MNQLKIIEPRGRYVETYQLDIQDRVVAVTNIESQVMSIDYGVGSFVKQITRFDGSAITNEYDQAGRLSHVLYSSASVPLASVDYTYYPDGQLQSISDGTSTNIYFYDALNRLSSVTNSVSSVSSVVNYLHDAVGNFTNTMVSIGGAQASATSYEYDEAERLTDVVSDREDATTQRFVYGYNLRNGRVSSIVNTNTGITCTYGYDLMERVEKITYSKVNGDLIHFIEYGYNAAGMIEQKRISNRKGHRKGQSFDIGRKDQSFVERVSRKGQSFDIGIEGKPTTNPFPRSAESIATFLFSFPTTSTNR